MKVRTQIIEDFNKAFKVVDVIVAPTSPTTAQKIGASQGQAMFGELQDILVEPSALAGLSGINVPVGFSKSGLPIGMDIIGPQFGEEKILNIAYKYEQENPFYLEKPKL